MVKDSPVWFSLPINFGGRVVDLSDWGQSGVPAALVTTTSSFYYGVGAATIGAMGLYWMFSQSSPKKVAPLVEPNMQTRQFPDGSRVCKHLKSDVLMRYNYPDALTLFEVVRRGKRVSKNGRMLGYRCKQVDGSEPYVWMRYSEVIDRSVSVAKGMRKLGLPVGQEIFIGVFSKNRPEWIIIEQATYAFSNVLVPLYETLGAESCTFIITQADIKIVFCDTVEKAEALLAQREKCAGLEHIVLIGDATLTDGLKQKAADANVNVYTFDDIERMGTDPSVSALELIPPRPEDLSTICYTSGTTGTPKGVMLTHGNVIANSSVLEYFKHARLHDSDVMMSFLPLAHMFERIVHAAIYTGGGAVGFFRGDIRGLADDIKTLQPTILPVVPRVLNRLYDKVLSEVNKSKVKKLLFDTAITMKTRELNNWIIRNDSLIDNIVFKKVREGLGGRVKLMITGSAPISENVLNFIRCAAGCVVIEGYGQTECVAACTVTIEGDPVPNHVGVPTPCNAIKLVDIPELNYFASDGAGEVCVRGTNVFQGYYKMPELTAETIDSDGWLHTGDIGRWTERGTLRIVDRKKHIFKLAQGEYVAPEKVENIYTRSSYVAQCFVHGESLKTCLIGIIVPDSEVIFPAAKSQFGLEGNLEELCKNEQIKSMILEDIQAVGKKSGLFSFEQVKDIFLSPEMFSVDNDLLTPTLKSKRPNIKTHYKKQLGDMYSRLD